MQFNKRHRQWHHLTLATLIVALMQNAAPAAEDAKPPSQEYLDKITERGKQLFIYDEGAARCTDAVMKLKKVVPNLAENLEKNYQFYLGKKVGNRIKFAFGKLSQDENKYLTFVEPIFDPVTKNVILRGKADEKLPTSKLEIDNDYLPMARALKNSIQKLKVGGSNYNYAVLPADNGEHFVYFYPGSSKTGLYLLGADMRFRVSADGKQILETRRMHNSILPYPRPGLPEGEIPVASCHTAIMRDEPEDTDVMHVLMRSPKMPEYVGTKNQMYLISVDGQIETVDKDKILKQPDKGQ